LNIEQYDIQGGPVTQSSPNRNQQRATGGTKLPTYLFVAYIRS